MTLAAWKAFLERQAQVRCNHPWHSPSQKMDSWPCLLSLMFLSHIRHWFNSAGAAIFSLYGDASLGHSPAGGRREEAGRGREGEDAAHTRSSCSRLSDGEGGSSGSSSTPEPPEPMDAEEEEVPVEGKALEEAVREAVVIYLNRAHLALPSLG